MNFDFLGWKDRNKVRFTQGEDGEEIEPESIVVFLKTEPLPKEFEERLRVLQEEILERTVIPSDEEMARLAAIETNLKDKEARDTRQQHKLAVKFSNRKRR